MQENNSYRENLHQGAPFQIYQNARVLRRSATEAEKKLWQLLRNRQLKGRKFRRQHAIDKYVLDFYCHECSLAIELDGGIHDDKMNRLYDQARTDSLEDLGITVIRFRNDEVIEEIESVMTMIAKHL